MREVRKTRFVCMPLLVLLAAGGLVNPLAAQPSAVSVGTGVSDLAMAPDLRIEDGTIRLSLEEAVELALERNLSLVVERFRLSEAGFNIMDAEGIYDFNLTADVNTSEDTSPSASNLDGADVQTSERSNWNLGLSRLVPSGGTASLAFNNLRSETNSIFATLNPFYSSGFDLNFRQPLMRDWGKLATERNIRVARNNQDSTLEGFELRVTQTLEEVEDAYWTLVEAREQRDVAQESLELAKQLHGQNRIRVDVGTLAPLELVQSEAGVANRELEIIRAEAAVGDGEDRLRQIVNLDAGDLWSLGIEPDTGAEQEAVEIDVDEAIATALAERPELKQKRLAQENLSIDAEVARNQMKPRLDLNVNYGLNGIGGDVPGGVNPFTGEIILPIPGGYSDALDQITDASFDGWSLGLNLAYPLRNRSGRARRALADVAFDRGNAELRDQELGVSTEVRRLVRAVRTAAQAREAARVSRELEEKNLEAEQKRYDNGMSTSFQVLEIQEDLSTARQQEVASVTGYRRALVQYYRAIGKLIERSGVEIVDSAE